MVVIGIGTDIVEIERIAAAIAKESFVKRFYTEAEQEIIKKSGAPSAAANFAAKEAVSKALGTGFRGFGPEEIEVLRDNLGKPFVRLHGGAGEISKALGVSRIHVSLSHSTENAIAFVILEADNFEN